MNQRPKCAVPNCENEAFIMGYGRWICGECYMKLMEKQKESFWKQIENGSS